MDAHHFDALVRSVTAAGSRRELGRSLARLAIAGAVGQVLSSRSVKAKRDGKKEKRKRRCRGRKTRCGRRCVNTDTNPLHCGDCGNRCQLNGVCVEGRCTCPKGDCTDPGLSCCPKELAVDCTGFTANNPQGHFTELETCGFTTECPADRQCVGPRFQACCPAGSRCDRATGTCLR